MISKGQIIRCRSSNSLFRVVHIESPDAWLIAMDRLSTTWPHRTALSMIVDRINAGSFTILNEQGTGCRSPQAWKHASRVFERFEYALVNSHYLLTPAGRVFILWLLRCDRPTTAKATYYRVIRRWFIGGCELQGLLPAWSRS